MSEGKRAEILGKLQCGWEASVTVDRTVREVWCCALDLTGIG